MILIKAFLVIETAVLVTGASLKPVVHVGNRNFIVIQQRLAGGGSFARSWPEYETGFGDGIDFWLGLRKINELTGSSPKLLRVEAVTWTCALYIAEYSDFSVGDATTKYTMTFGSYLTASSNMTSDSLNYHKGMKFSTMDQDNDPGSGSCSQKNGNSGWWYRTCIMVNPNGMYSHFSIANTSFVMWYGVENSIKSLKTIWLMLQV